MKLQYVLEKIMVCDSSYVLWYSVGEESIAMGLNKAVGTNEQETEIESFAWRRCKST